MDMGSSQRHESVGGANTSRRLSMMSTKTFSNWSKHFVYLDKVLKEWTADPEVKNKDSLLLGQSLEHINAFFAIRAEELPHDTILN